MKQLNGVILVDKPAGITSARVVARLKRRFSIDRIGHAGTLDPDATGLLIVLCGKAAKLQEFFLGESKAYRGTIRLGLATKTDDLSGETLFDSRGGDSFQRLLELGTDDLGRIAADLTVCYSGTYRQTPPQVSAVKIEGRRAYKSARKNIAVAIPPRTVTVSKLELSFCEGGRLQYFVRCSKGYYVRSLARDIGERLGVGGAIETLCRVESNPFELSQALALEQLESCSDPAGVCLPIEKLPLALPRIDISQETYRRLAQGDQGPLLKIGAEPEGSVASLFIDGAVFGGIVERAPGEGFKIRFLA